MAAVNDPLDAELDRAEAHFRPLVGPLARSTMPAATVTATLAALRTPPRRLPRLAPVLRHVAALAAAAGVVAAALLARSGAPGSGPAVPVGSLDAQAALLTGGEPIGVEFVEADPGSASASSLRALGGGVPRLAPVPAARNPKSRGGP